MELRQLQYFAAVARHRHFTRAAEALYVTQPALSQQIRRLEAELGLALLRRTSKGVELTPAGEDLLRHADNVLAEVEAARAEMDRHAGVRRGVARVAATAADAPRLPEALAEFHAEHPGIQIALRQGSAAEVVDLVRWMRRYNEEPSHKEKLRFFGFDMQSPAGSAIAVAEALGTIDRKLWDEVAKDLESCNALMK